MSNYIAKSQSGKKLKGSCTDSLWWSISDFSLQYEYIDKWTGDENFKISNVDIIYVDLSNPKQFLRTNIIREVWQTEERINIWYRKSERMSG